MSEFESIRKRVAGEDSSGLPDGSRKYASPRVDEILQDLHTREIEYWIGEEGKLVTTNVGPMVPWTWGTLVGLEDEPVEMSDNTSRTFHGQLSPIVEGYDWYRGFVIDRDEGQVVLFTPWMVTRKEGGSPDPIVYIRGAISEDSIVDVLRKHQSGVLSLIQEIRG